MNKNFKFFLTIWAVLFAIFNVVTFVPPSQVGEMYKFEGAFWVGYAFITLAFVGQLLVAYFAFNAKNLQKLFYKIPLIRISWAGLILTLIFGTVTMYFYEFPKWIGVVVCLAILGFNAISLVKADMAAELVGEIDDKVKAQTAFIKLLTVDAETLIARAQSDTAKAEAKKVYEAVRYSDPMSNSALAGVEGEISFKFNQFAEAVKMNNEDVSTLANEVVILINDRNKRCKLLK